MTDEERNELKHFLHFCGEIYQSKWFSEGNYDDESILDFYNYVLDNPHEENHLLEFFGVKDIRRGK
jgi:hypothetical protein